MIVPTDAIKKAKRSEYFGEVKLTTGMRASYKFENFIKWLIYFLPQWRKAKIETTLRFMFNIGDRVTTPHGGATVISNSKAIQSDGMGGFIETNVRFDTPPEPSLQNGKTDQYPYIGHYNQIFLEKE